MKLEAINNKVNEILEMIPDIHESVRVKLRFQELKLKLVQWQTELHDVENDPAVKEDS